MIEPTRDAGLARLHDFLPRAGLAYARGRNTSLAPGAERHVSALSPYLRHRLLTEAEVVAAARDAHGEAAQKFVEEVFWRTYWKGFLEQHPSIWAAYRREVARGQDRLATEGGLRRVYHDAVEGRSGIACFDAWAAQMVQENWLHNHVRMWFASIWIFTLRLPWALGAAFFLRHLLDGDPASNTLSWRWVAGLHTAGKHYVARAENIARYTEGRFDPRGELDEHPEPLREEEPHPLVRIPAAETPSRGEVALLLHEEDLCAETLGLGNVRRVGVMAASEDGRAAPVVAFVQGALADGGVRAAAAFGCAVEPVTDAAAWAAASDVPVVAAYAPLGPVAVPDGVIQVLRPWDAAAWPQARRGFFQMRAGIDGVIAAIG